MVYGYGSSWFADQATGYMIINMVSWFIYGLWLWFIMVC
jgi:hypothetical protein